MTKEDKQLQLEGLKANLANTERELKSFETALAENKDKLRLLEEQLVLRTKINDLSQANFGLVQKKWLWEELPEHNELLKQLSANEFQFKKYELESYIAQVKKNVAGIEEQTKSQLKAKELIEQQILEVSK